MLATTLRSGSHVYFVAAGPMSSQMVEPEASASIKLFTAEVMPQIAALVPA
jgi:hypothetical protein